MLPGVIGIAAASRQVLVYAVVTVVVSLALVPTGHLGWIYGITALVSGGHFVAGAAQLVADATPERAMKLVHYSNTYPSLLFVAISADVLVRAG